MKNRKNKNITTTVIAIIFALSITLPAIPQTTEAAENPRQRGSSILAHKFIHPKAIDIACFVGLGVGAASLAFIVTPAGWASLIFGVIISFARIPVIILNISARLAGAVTGCAAAVASSLGLYYILETSNEAVDSILSLEKSTEGHAILDELGNNEKIQVALITSDQTSGNSEADLDDTGI